MKEDYNIGDIPFLDSKSKAKKTLEKDKNQEQQKGQEVRKDTEIKKVPNKGSNNQMSL